MDLFLFYMWCICLGSVSGAVTADGESKRTYQVDSVRIALKPPKNITVFLVTETTMYISWQSPAVYPIHDWNATAVDFDDNTTSTTPSSQGTTVTSTVTTTPVSTEALNATTTAKGSNSTNGTGTSPVAPSCMPRGFFLNHNYSSNATNSTQTPKLHVDFVNNISSPGNVTETDTDDLMVPFDQACVEKYIVHYINNATGANLTMIVQPAIDDEDITEANITGLESNTTYTLYVAAQYISGHILNSQSIVTTTRNRECHCDYFGTNSKLVAGKRANILCNLTGPRWCFCNVGYTGLFCELCAPGYYRSGPMFECHRCPCSPELTIRPTCYFREGYLVCNMCKKRYSGAMCENCAYGFYRYNRKCIPCECHGNTYPGATQMCDPYLGYCIHCMHNTSGFNCERCVEGYVGDPIHKKNCMLKEDVPGEGGMPKGVIAGICIAIILTLSGLVGFAVYRRWKIFPPKKPFWTVELKEDRDSVNFSAVPENDFQNDTAGVDDLSFYESHGGKVSGKGVSRYSPLKEDI
ncbi:multiple epidermal growth factor-like domains protein 9 [Gigantopelta aegis]|uniref:multiple epidermal growth factor-like domains protein 9 n=1 Tax=Gigantopelta aegis TaxID=1735272 RepID=UPI001B888887|nr:multiple epidermal growth factor-like domains protein 9 [Gigantopelta aegis]